MQKNKLEEVQIKVNEITTQMQNNIQYALNNSDKIADIEQKSELLQESAQSFRQKGTQLKRRMRCRYWKQIAAAVLSISIISIIIYVIAR
jgi:hypothetical protein